MVLLIGDGKVFKQGSGTLLMACGASSPATARYPLLHESNYFDQKCERPEARAGAVEPRRP